MTENRIDEETPKRGGAEGGRFTGSTEDSGPMKPGNSVEEKTLTIRKGEINIPGLATLRASSKVGEAVNERWQ
jgi:hypothetical protein